MARVNYTPEQSVMKMREIDVLIWQGSLTEGQATIVETSVLSVATNYHLVWT